MDSGKPEIIPAQIIDVTRRPQSGFNYRFEYRNESSPDIELTSTLVEESEESRIHGVRKEALRRVLVERQINMITLSGTIGNGLFLGSGVTIARAGPGGAILAYALMGTVMSAIISCLGEMTALMPVNAPVKEFPRRFLDRGVGFAVAWMYCFAYAASAAQQLVAATRCIQFKYDDGRTYLNWSVGNDVDPAIWMTLLLLVVIAVNMLPVRVFGELEYVFGCIKLVFITMMIVLMLVLATMKPRANAYYHQSLGTKYWKAPYSFFNHEYKVKDESGNVQRVITGTMGKFLGEWTGIVKAIFSFTGMEIFAATAAESKSLGDAESMKMAARKITMRIVTMYCFVVFTASFVVPYDHPFLNGAATSAGAGSIFVIAAVEAGLPSAAHIFNAIFLMSSFTCALNTTYVASRMLHSLALQNQTGPEWITNRLRQCNSGVPRKAVLATSTVALLGYMGRGGLPAERLSQISGFSTSSYLIVFVVLGATYLRFFRVLQEVQRNSISPTQVALYDRNHPRYPYKSHAQWLKAVYGMIACLLLIIFQKVEVFLTRPFNFTGFIYSYVGIPIFILFILAYKVHGNGLKISRWGPERSNDLSCAIQASGERRRGRLKFENSRVTIANLVLILRWIWAWLK